MKITKKDKGTIKLALYFAIDYEESYLDALGDPDGIKNKEWAKELKKIKKRTKQNITNFKRLLTHFED